MPMDVLSVVRTALTVTSTVICLAASFLPWWFDISSQVSFDGSHTREDMSESFGLYYVNSGDVLMTSLILVDKATNEDAVPVMYSMAQLFYGIGLSILFVCAVITVIYLLRKYRSATGEIFLAGFLLPSAVCLILGLVFSALAISSEDKVWENLPLPDYHMHIYGTPSISIAWGFYVAAAGTLAAIVAAVSAWLAACNVCQHLEEVRYQMLHAPLTEEEKGTSHGRGRSYQFETKGGFRYDGYSRPGTEVEF